MSACLHISQHRPAVASRFRIDKLEFFNLDRCCLVRRKVDAPSTIIDLDNLAAGVHIVRVATGCTVFKKMAVELAENELVSHG